ncbi:hypothetical protein [[Clostridium] polysaccharolyticum]|uniref:Uncharacterized membrane protein n=1 Tax=[Clostridium] polysaccharolyticum TaxID=29364 RepID=A0A1I0AE17_9FIRM|nr:hypothetical protein [[Clostridium] polysaccharolyticum]SES92435.1 Uncharacterized membrane protein [[Clostridium] polysaccharolyticum]
MPDIHNSDPFDELKKDIQSNSADRTSEFAKEDIRANSAIAASAYIPLLFLLPFFIRPDSRFARFHANQGLILFILDAVLGIARSTIFNLPFVRMPVDLVVSLVTLGYFLYGFIHALNGKAKELPFIGRFNLIHY